MMILHPKGMDTICQVPGPKSVRTLGGGGPHLEISSSNIVPRQTSRPKLLIYEINVKSMWNQCEINVNIYLIYLQDSSGAHETSFETILRGPENGVLSATIGPPSRPYEDPSCFTDPNISVISWIIMDLYNILISWNYRHIDPCLFATQLLILLLVSKVIWQTCAWFCEASASQNRAISPRGAAWERVQSSRSRPWWALWCLCNGCSLHVVEDPCVCVCVQEIQHLTHVM